jgi:hypothetical protein
MPMRIISNLERKIIDRICEGHTHISTILTDHIPNLILEVDTDQERISLLVPQSRNQEEITRLATEQTEQIIYIISFLKYLVHEGYAISGFFSHGRVAHGMMGREAVLANYRANTASYVTWHFTDPRMVQYIFSFSDLTIMPIHQLVTFRRNGYRSPEDIRHSQIMKISFGAIFTALLIGAIGICQNFAQKPAEKDANYSHSKPSGVKSFYITHKCRCNCFR